MCPIKITMTQEGLMNDWDAIIHVSPINWERVRSHLNSLQLIPNQIDDSVISRIVDSRPDSRPSRPDLRDSRPSRPDLRDSRPSRPDLRDSRPSRPDLRDSRPSRPDSRSEWRRQFSSTTLNPTNRPLPKLPGKPIGKKPQFVREILPDTLDL